MQHGDEECIVLEEVISLETAAITNPKVRKKFSVVGCQEKITCEEDPLNFTINLMIATQADSFPSNSLFFNYEREQFKNAVFSQSSPSVSPSSEEIRMVPFPSSI